MALYIAADRELPVTAWDESRPAFNASPVGERDEGVRRQFTKRHVYYLGAHTGCSCGFAYGQLDVVSEKDREEDAAARTAVSALHAYVAEAVAIAGAVEMYACWEGEQSLPAEHQLHVFPTHFGGETFALRERAMYLVNG